MVAHLDSKSLAQVRFSVILKLIIMVCLNLLNFNLKIPLLDKSDVVRSSLASLNSYTVHLQCTTNSASSWEGGLYIHGMAQ
jgi:hypothetical protein